MKKRVFDTTLINLFGEDDYKNHIYVGRHFWYSFHKNTDEYILTQQTFSKLCVTFIRGDVMFYVLEGYPEREFSTKMDSVMCRFLILDELDPHKEMKLNDIDMYRFDDRFTNILNFDNTDIDVADDYYDIDFYLKHGKS